MRILEEFGIAWKQLAGRQKALLIGVAAVIALLLFGSLGTAISTWYETRRLEREITIAKASAAEHLKKAADLALKAKEQELKIAELEKTRDAKEKEANEATKTTLNAQLDYNRALREQRGDNPSTDQLCAELAALGYACQ